MSKVILVTGAGSGIGKATALQLIKEGHTVYGSARKLKKRTTLFLPAEKRNYCKCIVGWRQSIRAPLVPGITRQSSRWKGGAIVEPGVIKKTLSEAPEADNDVSRRSASTAVLISSPAMGIRKCIRSTGSASDGRFAL